MVHDGFPRIADAARAPSSAHCAGANPYASFAATPIFGWRDTDDLRADAAA